MTTITVNLDGLRELAAFRAEKGCAISLYVDLDPSVSPTSGDVATRVRSLLDVAAKSHGATRPDLAHEVKTGLKEDFERLDQYFDGEFDRDGARGLAVFAAGPDNVWSVLSLPSSVPDAARVADDFLIAPLVPLLGRGNGVIVAAVGREQGRVLELRGGRLQEIADRTEDTPGRHDQGGWSQARYQRHIEKLEHDHYKSVVEEIEDRFRRLGRPRIVVVCSDETRAELQEALPAEIADAIIGWTNAEAHASGAELHEIVKPFVEEWRAAREAEVVERWREEVGKGARGTAGWARHARGRVRRARRDAAPPGGRPAGRVPLPFVRPRRRQRDDLPARRDDDGAAGRRARHRRAPDARARRRRARGRASPGSRSRRRDRRDPPVLGSATRRRRSRAAARRSSGACTACGCSATGVELRQLLVGDDVALELASSRKKPLFE